jgi:hypothetical protein
MDVVYQVIDLRFVYAVEAIIAALVLAIMPRLTLRRLVTRAARRRKDEFLTIGKQPPMGNAA